MHVHRDEHPSLRSRHSRVLALTLLLVLLGWLGGLSRLPAQAPRPDDKETLRDRFRREQAQRLHEELLHQAQIQVERLADFYRRAVRDQLGRQTREQLQRLVEAEERKVQTKFEQASNELIQVGQTAEQLARELGNVEARLLKQQQPVEAALKKGDAKAVKQARLQVTYQRGEVQSQLNRLRTLEQLLGRAVGRLTNEGPRLTPEWKKGSTQQAATAAQQAQTAVNAVSAGKPAEAALAMKAGGEQLKRLAESANRVAAAFAVYRAADVAEAFARTTAAAADSLRQFADFAAAALKARDPELVPDVVRRMQLAAHGSALSLHDSRRFSEALTRAKTALKAHPKALSKAVPHALKALADLQKAQQHLVREESGKAGEKMTAAAGHLKELAKELQETRRQLGLEGDKDAAVLARETSNLLGNQFPRQVEEQFTRIHVGTVLPSILRKARDAAEKALPADTPALKDIREASLKEVEKVLGGGLLARVRAAEEFADAAGERLVQPARPIGPAKKPQVLATAERVLVKTIDQKLALLGTTGAAQIKFLLPVMKDVGPAIPTPPVQKKVLGIPQVGEKAITLDGDLSDWQRGAVVELDPIFRGTRKPVVIPAKQKAYVAYHARGLFIAVEVIDTSGALENQYPVRDFWLNDCLEVYVDTLNTKAAERGEPNAHQFFAFPFGHKDDPKTGGYEARMIVEKGKLKSSIVSYPADVIRRAAKKTERGWTMELFIPKEVLRHGDLTPGRTLGFNLQLDTGSDLYYYWNCAGATRISTRPDTWGEVVLLAADGKGKK